MNRTVRNDEDAFKELGTYLTERQSGELSTQLSVLRSALITFANEHGEEIKQNKEFNGKFSQICKSTGIDPLELMIFTGKKASKHDRERLYIGLSVKIVDVCQQTRSVNGGLISLKELHSRVKKSESIELPVSMEDIQQSLTVLDKLGKGYNILDINGNKWLKFSSALGSDISHDQKQVYELCSFMGGYITSKLLRDNYGWDSVRCKSVIKEMIMNGFLWIDEQGNDNEVQYWEPSWISK